MSASPEGPFCPVKAKLAYNLASAPCASVALENTSCSVKLSGSIGN